MPNPNQKLILIGAGGHAKSVIDVIEQVPGWTIVGYTDFQKKEAPYWQSFNYLGTDEVSLDWVDENTYLLITVGMIRNLSLRQEIFDRLALPHVQFAQVVAKTAYVSRNASLGKGTVVMHGAFLNSGVFVEANCIINTNAIIEHDTTIGEHSHISTAAVINADCQIGTNVFISSNVTINRGLKIGNHCIIGAGAVVTHDIPSNSIAFGVPARIIKSYAQESHCNSRSWCQPQWKLKARQGTN